MGRSYHGLSYLPFEMATQVALRKGTTKRSRLLPRDYYFA